MSEIEAPTKTTPKDRWRTPPYIVHWAARRWGPIGIDLAADEENAVVGKWLGGGSEWWTDSLAVEWGFELLDALRDADEAFHGWCNPPYSDIDPWVARAIAAKDAGFSTTMLIPSMPGEARFRNISRHATEIVFVIGRLAFLDHNERPVSGNTTGSCLVHFRAYDEGSPRVVWVRRDNMQAEHIQWERGEEVGHA